MMIPDSFSPRWEGAFRIKRHLFATILLLSLLGSAMPAFGLVVRLDYNRIWIIADQVPLQKILHRVAEQGIRVRIDPQLNPPVTAVLKDHDIQAGLSIILKSVNHVLIWETVPGPSGLVSRVSEIQVFEPGKKAQMIDLIRKRGFEIIRNPADGSLYVKDEILIRMQPGADLSELNRLLNKINGSVLDRDVVSGVYRIRLPDQSDVLGILKRIATVQGVSEAEPNYAYPMFLPTHVDGLPDEKAGTYKPDSKGYAAPIAILDSGIAIDAGIEDLVAGSLNAVNPGDPVADSLGHGTQMAYVASGTIKPEGVDAETGAQIPILPVKVFDENGFTSNYSIMQSIQFAIEHDATVISLSWGSETRSRFLEETLQSAEAKGLIVIASAGNKPTGKPVYPAAYPSVIGVGALTPDGKRWENSNYGDFVTLYAPGFGNFPVGYKGDPGNYAGTSISAAFTANVIADYLNENPGAKKDEILKMISARSKSSTE